MFMLIQDFFIHIQVGSLGLVEEIRVPCKKTSEMTIFLTLRSVPSINQN